MPEVPVLIRAMTGDDVPAVARLCGELGYPSSPQDVARRFAELSAAADNGLFVAESSGCVVGWIHVHGRHLLEAEPFAELGGLVVAAEHRRSGAGRALLARAEAWAVAHGYVTLRIRSGSTRSLAHRFYERMGYGLAKHQHVFTKAL